MTRRPMKRNPVPLFDRLHPLELWHARRNPAGIWVIVNEQGIEPLKHVDPVIRLHNFHVAASSTLLRYELRKLAERFIATCRDFHCEDVKINRERIGAAFYALMEGQPLYVDVLTAQNDARQGVIPIEFDRAA